MNFAEAGKPRCDRRSDSWGWITSSYATWRTASLGITMKLPKPTHMALVAASERLSTGSSSGSGRAERMRPLSVTAIAIVASPLGRARRRAQPRPPATHVLHPTIPLTGAAESRVEPPPRTDQRRVFDEYVQTGMRDWHVPGLVVAIVDGDSVVFQKAYGVRDVTTRASVDIHTRFAIGSTTKAR